MNVKIEKSTNISTLLLQSENGTVIIDNSTLVLLKLHGNLETVIIKNSTVFELETNDTRIGRLVLHNTSLRHVKLHANITHLTTVNDPPFF